MLKYPLRLPLRHTPLALSRLAHAYAHPRRCTECPKSHVATATARQHIREAAMERERMKRGRAERSEA